MTRKKLDPTVERSMRDNPAMFAQDINGQWHATAMVKHWGYRKQRDGRWAPPKTPTPLICPQCLQPILDES